MHATRFRRRDRRREHSRGAHALVVVADEHDIGAGDRRNNPFGECPLDFGSDILAPGFIDIHIHGGAGHDVMEPGTDPLPAVERLLAKHGVSGYFPTTVTAPLDATLSALARLADSIEAADRGPDSTELRAQALGIHLEGPFISHKRRGVHPPENLLVPSLSSLDRFWQAARGHIRMMTIAPELPGAMEVIAAAASRGICVSLGHSDAMRPLDHRDPGILGEVLTDSRLSADIIADGIHLDPAVVDLFLKAKGPESSVLITDATAATGMPDGRYRLGSLEVEVKEGRCVAAGKLAGSILTMDRAVRNVMQFAQLDLQQALRLATLNPARTALLNRGGSLKPGGPANILVLSPTGEVRNTMIRGAGI